MEVDDLAPSDSLQVDLGVAVQKACESQTEPLKFLYPLDIGIKEKIEAIAKSYGAAGVEYSEQVTLLSLHSSRQMAVP